MNHGPVRSRFVVILAVCYLLIGSVFGRQMPFYWPTPDRWIVLGLLALFLLLFALEPLLSRRIKFYIHASFVIQILIPLILLFIMPEYDSAQDYFAILFIPLCIQAMWRLPSRAAHTWVIIFSTLAMLSMVAYYRIFDGNWSGLGYGLAYAAVCILVTVFSSVTLRAEEARGELQFANHKLQEYALQVEHLAAVEERSRLARDLHDSVSQTIFSMTLTAQAARILLDRDPARVPAKLDHLQALAQSALAEMRYLIRHLGPGSLSGASLRECLARHVEERRVQDGLTVELQISGDRRLPAALEEGIFRVVQEALNNVVKHAKTDRAWVILRLDGDPISLCIEDRGVGFDPALVRPEAGHLGLTGIADRVQIMAGTIRIESQPGAGTRIFIDDIVPREVEHA
jgi:signal transduction histidine kinase